MYVILFSENLEGASWGIAPQALYYDKKAAIHDATAFGIHNPRFVYKIFRLTPLKGQ